MSATTALTSKQRDYLAEFKAGFKLVEDDLVRCAGIYVAALDESPDWKIKFLEEMDGVVPRHFWNELEAVGRKWKHVKLLFGGAGANAPLVKVLPYSDQERIFSDKVEMLTPTGEVLRVDIKAVASKQAEQIIDRKARTLRDIPAQRAYIESLKLPAARGTEVEAEVMPYTIAGGKVTFRRGVVLGRRELVRIVKELG